MKTKNIDLIFQAKDDLNGKWLVAVVAFFVAILVMGGIPQIYPNYYVGDLIMVVIGGAFQLGIAIFSLSIVRKQEVHIEKIFEGFNNFLRATGVYFIQTVLMGTLPLTVIGAIYTHGGGMDLSSGYLILLLIATIMTLIAIIVLSCMYGMSFFILADNPNIDVIEVLTRSRKMMNGYKLKFFGLLLWSVLFVILGILALFIGLLFVMPVLYVAYAKFYEDIKGNNEVSE